MAQDNRARGEEERGGGRERDTGERERDTGERERERERFRSRSFLHTVLAIAAVVGARQNELVAGQHLDERLHEHRLFCFFVFWFSMGEAPERGVYSDVFPLLLSSL